MNENIVLNEIIVAKNEAPPVRAWASRISQPYFSKNEKLISMVHEQGARLSTIKVRATIVGGVLFWLLFFTQKK